jgi:hypothetical protein
MKLDMPRLAEEKDTIILQCAVYWRSGRCVRRWGRALYVAVSQQPYIDSTELQPKGWTYFSNSASRHRKGIFWLDQITITSKLYAEHGQVAEWLRNHQQDELHDRKRARRHSELWISPVLPRRAQHLLSAGPCSVFMHFVGGSCGPPCCAMCEPCHQKLMIASVLTAYARCLPPAAENLSINISLSIIKLWRTSYRYYCATCSKVRLLLFRFCLKLTAGLAVGSIMNVRWISMMRVEAGSFCIAQGSCHSAF